MEYTVKPRPGAVIPEAVKPPIGDIRQFLRVIEMFTTPMQGEGLLTGVPSTFVRFGGCSVGCFWCDTKFSWKAHGRAISSVSSEYLADKVDAAGKKHVVLTGGEPLEQNHLLLAYMIGATRKDHHWTVETSGVVLPDECLRPIIHLWSVSPKLAHAETSYERVPLDVWQDMWLANNAQMQIKFVIDCADLKTIERDVDQVRDQWVALRGIKPVLVFQPITPSLDACQRNVQILQVDLLQRTAMLAEYLELNWREGMYYVRPQMHALLWGWKRGI